MFKINSSNGGKPSVKYRYNYFCDEYQRRDDSDDEDCDDTDLETIYSLDDEIEKPYLEWLGELQYLGCRCRSCKNDDHGEELRDISRRLEKLSREIEETRLTALNIISNALNKEK